MKMEFYRFKLIFGRDDAFITIPIILLILSLSFSTFNKNIEIACGIVYYAMVFSSSNLKKIIKHLIETYKLKRLKCPKCGSKKILLQGYQPYHSDEYHPFYICTNCDTTSIMTNGGLTYL